MYFSMSIDFEQTIILIHVTHQEVRISHVCKMMLLLHPNETAITTSIKITINDLKQST